MGIGDKVQFKGENDIITGVIFDIMIMFERRNKQGKLDNRCRARAYLVYCIRNGQDEYRCREENLARI